MSAAIVFGAGFDIAQNATLASMYSRVPAGTGSPRTGRLSCRMDLRLPSDATTPAFPDTLHVLAGSNWYQLSVGELLGPRLM